MVRTLTRQRESRPGSPPSSRWKAARVRRLEPPELQRGDRTRGFDREDRIYQLGKSAGGHAFRDDTDRLQAPAMLAAGPDRAQRCVEVHVFHMELLQVRTVDDGPLGQLRQVLVHAFVVEARAHADSCGNSVDLCLQALAHCSAYAGGGIVVKDDAKQIGRNMDDNWIIAAVHCDCIAN